MKTISSLFLCAVLVCTTALAQKAITKTYPGVKKIRMTTKSGSCKITRGGKDVVLSLEHTYDSDEYEPEIELEGDRLMIGERFNERNTQGTANWTLQVPDGTRIDFNTGSGDISVGDVNIEFDSNTGSGNIFLTGTKGNLDCNTGSGDIELEQFDGEIKGNTGSGSIKVRQSLGDLRLNTGSGNVRVTNSKAAFSLNTGSGNIDAEGVTLTGASRFNTGSGDSEVVLAAAPKHDISVNSGSGDALLDFNGNEIAGQVVMKMDKRNGKITAPFSFDKTEEEDNGNNGRNVMVIKTAQRGTATNRIMVGTGSGEATLQK